MFNLKTQIVEYLSVITGRINNIPDDGGLITSVNNGGGLELKTARPISSLAVGDTDGEITQLKATEVLVMDSRSGTLWVKDGGSWSSSNYTGDDDLLRPGTFCVSFPNNRMYYFGADLVLQRVSLSTVPTPI